MMFAIPENMLMQKSRQIIGSIKEFIKDSNVSGNIEEFTKKHIKQKPLIF